MTEETIREDAAAKRHSKGYRTARENLQDLCDDNSFVEYGELAVAAQRQRRSIEYLRANTQGDGVITGLATVNSEQFGSRRARCAVAIYDFSVLAGTQGYYHHKKLDRILSLARDQSLPVLMYTEGGGGRPGDTDITTQIAGLNIPSFALWAGLAGKVPRIAINNGYCFAGNAALFGSADIRIATETSWIGMAGPAMIEGGGLGMFAPTDVGPSQVQLKNGVIDVLVADEAAATACAKTILAYFQGPTGQYECADQDLLRNALPDDRRYSYKMRGVIEALADAGSFTELGTSFGSAIITGLARAEGMPLGLIANDPRVLGGAIDSNASQKAARFLRLCEAHGLAVLSLCDTPGFMVGPDSEKEGAVHYMSDLFLAGASLTVPLITICLRKGYGLGAMAMAGGSFATPLYTAAWPTGEFGAMGIEGAVKLGYRKELAAASSDDDRDALFDKLVEEMYEKGKAVEAATHLEIDAVIDPADTRKHIVRTLASGDYGGQEDEASKD